MAARVASIHRYPVKALGGEALDAVELAAGAGLPYDRRFAIARGGTSFDPAAPTWLPRTKLVALVKEAELARLASRFDPATGVLALCRCDAPATVEAPVGDGGPAPFDAFLNDFFGARRGGPVHLIEAGPLSFTDVPENCLSLVNLESVRDLAQRMDATLQPARFRANVYVSGGAPWEELGWVGQEVDVGAVRLRVSTRIPRCAATAVNVETAVRDHNVVKGLRGHYGHSDMGVYVEVVRGGRLAVGDALVAPGVAGSTSQRARVSAIVRFTLRNLGIWWRGRAAARSSPGR